jgi:SOS-response transcriptional repressor LexA
MQPAEMGAKIRAARKARDWTRARLAAESSVDPDTIGRWERGEFKRVTKDLERALEILGLAAPDMRPQPAAPATTDTRVDPALYRALAALQDYLASIEQRLAALEVAAPREAEPPAVPAPDNVVALRPAAPVDEDLVEWRLMGRIAAGAPAEALRSSEMRSAPAALASPRRYLLEVRGDSMAGAGIADRALAVCECIEGWGWQRGDYVCALIDREEATLKRYVRSRREGEGRRIWLAPQNPDYDVQEYGPDHEVVLQGRVVAWCNPGEAWRSVDEG